MEWMENIGEQLRVDGKNVDTYSYRGWFVSDRFYKRFLAFFGYTVLSLVLLVIIYVGVLVLSFIYTYNLY